MLWSLSPLDISVSVAQGRGRDDKMENQNFKNSRRGSYRGTCMYISAKMIRILILHARV